MITADIAIKVENLSITKLEDKWCLTPFFVLQLCTTNIR